MPPVPPPGPKPPLPWHICVGSEPCGAGICTAAPWEGQPLFPRAVFGSCPALGARGPRCHPSALRCQRRAVTMEMRQRRVRPSGKCRAAERQLCSEIISRNFYFYLTHCFHSSPSCSLVDIHARAPVLSPCPAQRRGVPTQPGLAALQHGPLPACARDKLCPSQPRGLLGAAQGQPEPPHRLCLPIKGANL